MPVGGIPVTVVASGGAPMTPVGLTADLVAADGDQSVQEALDTLTSGVAGAQPLDADLTAIAALSTTAYGRALLTLADLTATQTALAIQPLDADLTAIAALSTTAYGRSLLTLADLSATQTALAIPKRLFSTSIPFIYPSSGTMGNNGALTVTTALPVTYPKAYVYLPANAISAGSAAGWYYAVFSSTTVAQVFNNAYVAGTVPSVPGSPTAFATTGPGAYTQTTGSNIVGPTFTMAANTFGTTGRLRVEMAGRSPSNANAKQINCAIGGTGVFTQNLVSGTGTEIVGRLKGQSVTNKQVASIGPTTLVPTDVAIDMTAANAVELRFNMATATDYLILNASDIVLEA